MSVRATPTDSELVIRPTAEDINPHAFAVRRRRVYFGLAWLAPVGFICLRAAGVHSGFIAARFFQ